MVEGGDIESLEAETMIVGGVKLITSGTDDRGAESGTVVVLDCILRVSIV